jgi:molybdopterin biosynthesis enzyme
MTDAQIIAKLTPLAAARAMLETGTEPVPARERVLADAAGCVLAEDVRIPSRPAAPLALRDGWALRAEETLGASGQAPVPLTETPIRIEAGTPVPPGRDCVASLDAVRIGDGIAEALEAVAPGAGLLPAGGDVAEAHPVKRAGERLKTTDLAALAALGLATARLRLPRFALALARDDAVLKAAMQLVAADAKARGAEIEIAAHLDEALADEGVDAVIGVGGTGSGRNDASVTTLARAGRVALHGLALSPGETAALGFVVARPVLLLPGRIDAALAVWLLLGRPLLDRLAGVIAKEEGGTTLPLARKIASTVGMTELIPVRCSDGQAEPLAANYLPLSVLSRADGYVVIPPESEGSSAGSAVRVWRWP